MTTTRRRLAALVAGLLLLLSACSGTDDSGGDSASGGGGEESGFTADTTSAEGGAEDAAGDGDALAAAEGESASGGGNAGGGGNTVDPAVAAENRQIISVGEIHITVADLNRAVRDVERLVGDARGLIFGEDTDLRTGARTRLVVKVPPERFRLILADLADLGEVQTQSVTTDDVTDQVVDLDSRIATAEASVFRLRALLADADVVADIAHIEGQLLQRETDLETLRGQRRTIEQQVAMATITVVLRGERTAPPPPPEPEDPPQKGFLDGLRGGARALRTVAIGLSAVAGALLPWSPLLLVAGFVIWRVTRRKPVTPAT